MSDFQVIELILNNRVTVAKKTKELTESMSKTLENPIVVSLLKETTDELDTFITNELRRQQIAM